MPDKKWLKAATVRAIKTIAQTAVATMSVGVFVEDINWWAVLSSSLLSGMLSMMTSLAGIPEIKD